jgi:hypothetical protein
MSVNVKLVLVRLNASTEQKTLKCIESITSAVFLVGALLDTMNM